MKKMVYGNEFPTVDSIDALQYLLHQIIAYCKKTDILSFQQCADAYIVVVHYKSKLTESFIGMREFSIYGISSFPSLHSVIVI